MNTSILKPEPIDMTFLKQISYVLVVHIIHTITLYKLN